MDYNNKEVGSATFSSSDFKKDFYLTIYCFYGVDGQGNTFTNQDKILCVPEALSNDWNANGQYYLYGHIKDANSYSYAIGDASNYRTIQWNGTDDYKTIININSSNNIYIKPKAEPSDIEENVGDVTIDFVTKGYTGGIRWREDKLRFNEVSKVEVSYSISITEDYVKVFTVVAIGYKKDGTQEKKSNDIYNARALYYNIITNNTVWDSSDVKEIVAGKNAQITAMFAESYVINTSTFVDKKSIGDGGWVIFNPVNGFYIQLTKDRNEKWIEIAAWGNDNPLIAGIHPNSGERYFQVELVSAKLYEIVNDKRPWEYGNCYGDVARGNIEINEKNFTYKNMQLDVHYRTKKAPIKVSLNAYYDYGTNPSEQRISAPAHSSTISVKANTSITVTILKYYEQDIEKGYQGRYWENPNQWGNEKYVVTEWEITYIDENDVKRNQRMPALVLVGDPSTGYLLKICELTSVDGKNVYKKNKYSFVITLGESDRTIDMRFGENGHYFNKK